MKRSAALLLVSSLAGCGGSPLGSSVPTVLFAPIDSTSTYLMSLDGQKLHEWTSPYPPGYSVYLLPNGNLLRTNSVPERPLSDLLGSNGGQVEILDWNSNVVWRYDYATIQGQQHHDAFYMPNNGHVLMVAWEVRSAAEAIATGRNPTTLPADGQLWVDKIVEVDPASNQVVWEWRTWDHLVPPGASPAEHPGLVDVNYVSPGTALEDWTHVNAVYYEPSLDQVLISVRNFSEIWIVDHGTTTAEAAGHTGGRLGRGGDLVYRWGNPAAMGLDAPRQLYGQHNAQWIPAGLPGAGHILVFDNGDAGARPYSRVVELVPPLRADRGYDYDPATGYGPAAPSWEYVAQPAQSLFAPIISGAHRLASGNTLVTVGTEGRFFEVNPAGATAWSYVVRDTSGGTNHLVFRATRYEAGYEGLADRELESQGPLVISTPTAEGRATIKRY